MTGPLAALAWGVLLGMVIACLIGSAAAVVIGALALSARLGALMDDGDGQGGIPPLPGITAQDEEWLAAQARIPGMDDEEGWPWP